MWRVKDIDFRLCYYGQYQHMVTCAMNLFSPSEIPLIRFIIPDTQFYLSMSTRTYDRQQSMVYVLFATSSQVSLLYWLDRERLGSNSLPRPFDCVDSSSGFRRTVWWWWLPSVRRGSVISLLYSAGGRRSNRGYVHVESYSCHLPRLSSCLMWA